jgi:hypothetical protein
VEMLLVRQALIGDHRSAIVQQFDFLGYIRSHLDEQKESKLIASTGLTSFMPIEP